MLHFRYSSPRTDYLKSNCNIYTFYLESEDGVCCSTLPFHCVPSKASVF